ncbi:MAG: glycosyltransferase family 2 protein, partial [Candidatus Hydrothermarchaeaceae archaeon]
MKCVAVIPVYNEEKTIREVVERAAKVVDKVIVVDDRSGDNSAEEAREAGAHVIKIQKNKGKANALKEGFKLCSNYDIIVMLDGDLQHLPEEIPALVKCVESEGDLCIGSRFKK